MTLHMNLFLGNFSPGEILMVAMVILIFFGGKKIPELMRGLGQGIKEFNNARANIETEVKESMKEIEKPTKVEANPSTKSAE